MEPVLNILRYVAVAVGILLIGGTVYQWLGARADAQALQPPGELVTVEGSQQHIDCRGEGEPTVILLAGGGNTSVAWTFIHDDLAEHARVCAVDRMGFGFSQDLDRPHELEDLTDVLDRVLDEAGVPGPYILVGHSLGGMEAQLYAHRHPEDVAGMVLVDSGHADFWERVPEFQGQEGFIQFVRGASRVGLVRLLVALDLAGLPDWFADLPADARQRWAAEYARPSHWDNALAMNRGLEASSAQLAQVEEFPPVPVVVIPHGIADQFEHMEPEAGERAALIWRELQHQLAQRSPYGRLVVADESGHMVPLEQPDLVTASVLYVLAEVETAD